MTRINSSQLEKVLMRSALVLFLGGLAISARHSKVGDYITCSGVATAALTIPFMAYNGYKQKNSIDYQI